MLSSFTAVRVNHIQFGDCPVRKPCCRTFTITNHTRTKVLRFEWEASAPFQFSPKVSLDCSAFPHCSSPTPVFPGAGRESSHTSDSPFQCHVGDAVPGLAGPRLPALPKRHHVMGGGSFCSYFVYQTSHKSTLRCRFLAQLLTTSVPLAVSPALGRASSLVLTPRFSLGGTSPSWLCQKHHSDLEIRCPSHLQEAPCEMYGDQDQL